MNRRVCRCVIFVLMLFSFFQSNASAKKVGFEYWHAETLAWKASNDWGFNIQEEQRIDDDASHYYYQEYDIAATYAGLAKWFDLSLGFKHVLSEVSNRWKREEWPAFAGTFKFKAGPLSLSDRNRFEYRIREAATDFWCYRNLLTIKFPWKVTPLEIQPYLADEVFINETVSENRSFAGFTCQITKAWSGDIYYMQKRRRSGGGDWVGANVVGTKVKFSF